MKKLLLILALCPLVSFSQVARFDPSIQKRVTGDVSFPNPKQKKVVAQKTSSSQAGQPSTQVGYTAYDLQSNAAISRRIIQHSGNKISVMWTTSTTGSSGNFSDRGSGYNHYDGTKWVYSLADASARRENTRTGWPTFGVIQSGGNNVEYLMSHAVTATGQAGGFFFGKNTQVGDNVFTGSVVLNDTYKSSEPGPIWGRSVSMNGKIFLISAFAGPNASAGQPDTPKINGVKLPNVYSIYDVASDTWVVKNQTLPFYDSTQYAFGNADAYAIDAANGKVAIVIGGLQDDLALWQSTDNGQNWTKTIIDTLRFPRAVHDRNNPIIGNNGAVDVLIDNNGKTHVFYAWLGSFYDSINTTDTLQYVFYGSPLNGIIHWSEYSDARTLVGGMQDVNGNTTLDLGTNTRARDWGGYGNALSFNQNGATVTYSALTNMPSASIDANGVMYVTFTSLIEDDLSADDENYSDIYVSYSTDSGKTWSNQINLTQTPGIEDVFPCQTRLADGKIHILYLEKSDPGIFVGQTSGNNPEQANIPLKYMEVATTDIVSGKAGIKTNPQIDFALSQNVPNPFNGYTTFLLNLKKAGKVSVVISNAIGQQVYANNMGTMNAGNQNLEFNSGKLPAGIYFYTVTVDGQSLTRRMVIE